jgi:hypothetical protein
MTVIEGLAGRKYLHYSKYLGCNKSIQGAGNAKAHSDFQQTAITQATCQCIRIPKYWLEAHLKRQLYIANVQNTVGNLLEGPTAFAGVTHETIFESNSLPHYSSSSRSID